MVLARSCANNSKQIVLLYQYLNGGPCGPSVKNYNNIQYGANLSEWPLNSQDCTNFYIVLTFSLALSMLAMSLAIMRRLGTCVFQRKCSMSASFLSKTTKIDHIRILSIGLELACNGG